MKSKLAFRTALASIIAIPLLSSCSAPAEESPSVWSEADSSPTDGAAPKNQFGFVQAMETGPSLDIFPAEREAPAGISVTAAPGVAFTYRYAFVLPSDLIAGQQEKHASACEALGAEKCRITGMRYKLIDEDKVEAYLKFKLVPELARDFGKDGIAAVEESNGRLVDAVIVGEDAQTKIRKSEGTTAQLEEQLAAAEKKLRDGGFDDASEKARAEQQVRNLRGGLRAEEQTRENAADSLANTPMTFYYRGDEGFTLGTNPVGDSASSAWFSLTAMLSFVLTGLGVVVPWLLLALGLIALWRSRPVRRIREWVGPLRRKKNYDEAVTEE